MNNDYADPFLLENPPQRVDVAKLQRNILADKPRVTRFPIDWSPAGDAGNAAMEGTENAAGAPGANALDLDMDFVDDEELVKAAAQLDHNYTDIVISGEQMEDDVDLEEEEDNEADSVEEAEEDDQEMDIDIDEDL